jgi:hypothetical protein
MIPFFHADRRIRRSRPDYVTESLPGIVLKHNEHPEGFRVLVAFRNTPN